MSDDLKQLNPSDDPALEAGDDTAQLQSGSDLAAQALAASAGSSSDDPDFDTEDETEKSDQLAATLNTLQNVIERNAQQLEQLRKEMKEKRDSLKSVFENDTTLAEAEQQLDMYSQEVKQRKSKLQSDPQVTSLKVQIGEISERVKEIEETLSNHLVNYYQLTNSKSFDTSDGDQWEFDVRAKVKSRKK